MVTFVPALAAELDKLARLAASDVPVLLSGESGTGKEVLARAFHGRSGRRGELVAVNCGAIPESLVESELFGHRKGAFSGAVADSEGLVRAADGGTLFLDEIADLPPPSQAALLRVLQEREVRPVGGVKSVPVDIRLVSATHRDLAAQVAAGAFREDLYARISGFRIRVPPLRERREDLGFLIGLLLDRMTDGAPPEISVDVARLLFAYDWPRNIRELETTLRAALVLSGGDTIELEHVPADLRPDADEPPADSALSDRELAHREQLIALLRDHAGNISAVSRALGKDRKQVHRWLKRYGLAPDDFRS
jgi:DNA-binding NtrC family response regulator